jgi:hypothetical protein
MKIGQICKCEGQQNIEFTAETYETRVAQPRYIKMLCIEFNPHISRNMEIKEGNSFTPTQIQY